MVCVDGLKLWFLDTVSSCAKKCASLRLRKQNKKFCCVCVTWNLEKSVLEKIWRFKIVIRFAVTLPFSLRIGHFIFYLLSFVIHAICLPGALVGKFRGTVPTPLEQHLMKAMKPLHIRLLTGLRTATGIFQGMDGFLLYYLLTREGRRVCSRSGPVLLRCSLGKTWKKPECSY